MRKVALNRERLTLVEDQILGFLERIVTPFGNSAKVDCPKEYSGKRAYLIIVRKRSARAARSGKRTRG